MKRLVLVIFLSYFSALHAGGVYQEPDAFIAEVFDGNAPKPGIIWLNKDLKLQLKEILGHDYKGLRVRYWQLDGRSAWILDEIGKGKPITTSIVVNNGRIERVRVLVFRESRGWEVRHSFFTEQFDDATLKENRELDRRIDNISGATLSVRAVTRLARIALLLDQQLEKPKAG